MTTYGGLSSFQGERSIKSIVFSKNNVDSYKNVWQLIPLVCVLYEWYLCSGRGKDEGSLYPNLWRLESGTVK